MLTTKGTPLVKGGSLFQSSRIMKIKILKPVVAKSKSRKINEIVEVTETEAMELINYGDAIEFTDEPKKAGRIKKNA